MTDCSQLRPCHGLDDYARHVFDTVMGEPPLSEEAFKGFLQLLAEAVQAGPAMSQDSQRCVTFTATVWPDGGVRLSGAIERPGHDHDGYLAFREAALAGKFGEDQRRRAQYGLDNIQKFNVSGGQWAFVAKYGEPPEEPVVMPRDDA